MFLGIRAGQSLSVIVGLLSLLSIKNDSIFIRALMVPNCFGFSQRSALQHIGKSSGNNMAKINHDVFQLLAKKGFFESIQSKKIDEKSKSKKKKETSTIKKETPTIKKVNLKSTDEDLIISNTKIRRLKDRMWVRETLEDITAAEFACTLDSLVVNDDESKKTKTKRAVDFENILYKLDRRVEDMCTQSTYSEQDSPSASCFPLDHNLLFSDTNPSTDQRCWVLMSGKGMGSLLYSHAQRDALLMRIVASRMNIIKAMQGKDGTNESEQDVADLDEIREQLKSDDVQEENKNVGTIQAGDPMLYVRDDGTVDWEGALQDRTALKKFGVSVWSRINGEDPETFDEDKLGDSTSHEKKPATAKIVETDAIREEKKKLDIVKNELDQIVSEHTKLLNSAVTAGSAVANVNLATLNPKLRAQIRSSADAIERKQEQSSFQQIIYELERIYTYLDSEMGNTFSKGYIPLQDRLNVAEFGLLESQVEALNKEMKIGEEFDSDVLSVVLDQTVDFKRRLGIDYYVTGLTFDKEAITSWLNESLAQTKKALAFYGKGCKLFWEDIVFSSFLVSRALQGYTLKPREVRTLRRSVKDFFTFIPVIIILIIPISPVGHVLVFGAIQRFFPDFFPSCFTEQRQNLLQLYENTEYSEMRINENWQERTVRILEATGYLITSKIFNGISGDEITENKEKVEK